MGRSKRNGVSQGLGAAAFGLLWAASVSSASAAPIVQTAKADILLQGIEKQKVYTLETTAETDGPTLHRKNRYADLDNHDAVLEDVQARDGQLVKYHIDQKQIGASGDVEVKDGQVHFRYMQNGDTKEASEKLEGNLVVGPILIEFMLKHWEELLKGETLPIRLAVAERRETVGFKLFKDTERTESGQTLEVVEMKPSSLVIAALVKPLYFDFNRDTHAIVAIHGRTVPKLRKGDKWTDLDANLVYQRFAAAESEVAPTRDVTAEVAIQYSNGDCTATVQSGKQVPRQTEAIDTLVHAFLSGPSRRDLQKGLVGPAQGLAPLYLGHRLKGSEVVLRFKAEAMSLLNSTTCEQTRNIQPLEKTLFELPEVKRVTYEVGGKVIDGWDA